MVFSHDSAIAFGTASHVGGLRRPSFHLVRRELFEICDAGLEPLYGLAFTDIARRALVVYPAVAGGTPTCASVTEVVLGATVGCTGDVARGEVGRLMVLGVVHYFINL